MQLHARRRHAAARCRALIAAVAVVLSLAALLCLGRVPPGGLLSAPARTLQLAPARRLHVRLGAVKGYTATATPSTGGLQRSTAEVDAAVLLPDWEVLVLLRPEAADATGNVTCRFRSGASSPARDLGRLPAPAMSGRSAYACVVPEPARRHKTLAAPQLVITSSSSSTSKKNMRAAGGGVRSIEMLRWNWRLVYESAAVDGGDVLVFAKGVNPRQGVNRPASDIQCVYYHRRGNDDNGDHVVATLLAATSAQQVFRCPPPPLTAVQQESGQELRITLAVTGQEPIPSLAVYSPPRPGSVTSPAPEKKLICACTMVRDVAKFLREWVVYTRQWAWTVSTSTTTGARTTWQTRFTSSARPGTTSPPWHGLGPRPRRPGSPTALRCTEIRASGWRSSTSTSSYSPHGGTSPRTRASPCSGPWYNRSKKMSARCRSAAPTSVPHSLGSNHEPGGRSHTGLHLPEKNPRAAQVIAAA